MPFCNKCGNKLTKEDAAFCPDCGAPIGDTKPSKERSEGSTDDFKTKVRGKSFSYGVLNLENLPAGHIIDERYEVKRKLGQGGFGAVYLVFDQKMQIDKALKVIPEAIVNDEEAMVDLQNESRTMIALNHPHIVRVYDFHDTGAVKYIDMEFVVGKTLTKFKIEHPNKQVPETKVKELAIKIADGLSYAHSKGIIHKDIKPQNVMITREGEVKLMDFGIAETVRTSMSRIQNTSSSGTLVYMSPEQLLGKDVGKESDIYSFGAMLYELLSGHPPFYKGDINYQILSVEPEKLENVSDKMNDIVLKCLEKEYGSRFSDFSELNNCLQSNVDIREVRIIEKNIHNEKDIEGSLIKIIPQESSLVSNPLPDDNMVFVQGGTFNMGSNKYGDEKPIHTVKIDDFYILKYEVTQKEWKKVMESNPSYFEGDNLPVERVSWYDAVEFCNAKSRKLGLTPCYSGYGNKIKCDFGANGYRLPTEAEWEFAARGGNKSIGHIYSGDDKLENIGWFKNNTDGKTYPVGLKKTNELDIYDMSGNVWEWCNDWYKKNFYSISPNKNPKGPAKGKLRVLRGGSYFSVSNKCRTSYRSHFIPPYNKDDNCGIRLVRNMVK